MATFSDKIISVVSKRPEQRTDFEVSDIVPWFRTKSALFKTVKPGIIRDVIRNCGYLHPQPNDVVIAQGDSGDKLYIVVKGSLSIFVLQDKTPEEAKELVDAAILQSRDDTPIDREQLGLNVWTTGEGGAVGEVALIREDCIRTASVVANDDTAMIVVDRNLYNVSVRDVIEHEFRVKTSFVESHWLFRQWTSRHKKQMAISLHREIAQYGCPLARQGQPAEQAYFILSGEVQMTVDTQQHTRQYPELWEEMHKKFPFLLPLEARRGVKPFTPHEELKRRKVTNRKQTVCLLRGFEYLGFLELLLGLDTYALSAHCTSEAEVLTISRDQFERFIEKRYPDTIVPLRREIATRLNLFLLRIQKAAVLEYLLLKLQDSQLIKIYNKEESKIWVGDCLREEIKKMRAIQSQSGYDELMDLLQTRYVAGTGICEPDEQTTNDLLEKLEGRIRDWLNAATPTTGGQASKGGVVTPRVAALKRFQIQNTRENPRGGNKVLTQAPNTQ